MSVNFDLYSHLRQAHWDELYMNRMADCYRMPRAWIIPGPNDAALNAVAGISNLGASFINAVATPSSSSSVDVKVTHAHGTVAEVSAEEEKRKKAERERNVVVVAVLALFGLAAALPKTIKNFDKAKKEFQTVQEVHNNLKDLSARMRSPGVGYIPVIKDADRIAVSEAIYVNSKHLEDADKRYSFAWKVVVLTGTALASAAAAFAGGMFGMHWLITAGVVVGVASVVGGVFVGASRYFDDEADSLPPVTQREFRRVVEAFRQSRDSYERDFPSNLPPPAYQPLPSDGAPSAPPQERTT